MTAGRVADPPANPGTEAGTDQEVGMAMEEEGSPSRVTSDTPLWGSGGRPSIVIPAAPTGGVNSPTSVTASPPSGARQFEQLTAPGGFRTVQCGQSILGPTLIF